MASDFTPRQSNGITLNADHNVPWYVPPRKFKWLIAEYEIGGTTFNIYGSRHRTLEEAEKKLRSRTALILAYQHLTGDMRSALPFNAVTRAMICHVQVKWFEFNGFEVPVKVASNEEESMAKAAKAAATDETEGQPAATKEKRVTNRSIIESGLRSGKSDEDILAEVKEHFPEGKADMKHVAYYRHFLVKAGEIEAQPRKSRAKAPVEATETAPAPVKAQAAKAAPAKATAGKPVAAPAKAGKR